MRLDECPFAYPAYPAYPIPQNISSDFQGECRKYPHFCHEL